MIHFVEEVFQIYIHNVFIAIIDILMRLLYRLLSIAIGSEAIAVWDTLARNTVLWLDLLLAEASYL